MDVLMEQKTRHAQFADRLLKLCVSKTLFWEKKFNCFGWIVVTFLLNQDKYTEDIALSWEKQVFEKVIDDYNRGNLTNDQNITLFNNITVTYMAQRSITDELVDQTKYLL